MEQRRAERRKLIRGYGPDRRVADLLPPSADLRRGEQRRRDRRQVERRKKNPSAFSALKSRRVVPDE